MPYTFVDTIEHSSTETMPAEALQINGEYIENLMDARYCKYRTLYVKGREILSPEITSFETGVRNGSSFLSRRYPERILTIGFILQASSNYYFRMAFNELNRILNVENAELIFYDEQDKYFIGTPAGIEEEPDPGSNFIKAEFNIICNDPFKYSIVEYEVEPSADNGSTFIVEYNGTAPSFPTLEADFYEESECGTTGSSDTGMTGDGDCGYVAWFNEDAKIIQLGDPEEEEGESFDKSQTLFSQSFKKVSAWTSALNNIWEKNYNKAYVAMTTGWVCDGTPGFMETSSGSYYLTETDSKTVSSGWRGCTVSRTFPADATGETSATDWTIKWSQLLCIGNSSSANKQRGGIEVLVLDANDKVIAGSYMYKGSEDSGSTGRIRLYLNNKQQKELTGVNFSYSNSRWGAGGSSTKSCSMVKSGSTVKFNLGGSVWSLTSSSITSTKAVRIVLIFAVRASYERLYRMGISEVTFTKDNCTTWVDIPNKFTANDVAVAECASGTVLLNGAESPEYGALGNDWESFYLQPGINQIGFSYSDWCEKAPTTKMRYREVFL